jgi:hypothetical protein
MPYKQHIIAIDSPYRNRTCPISRQVLDVHDPVVVCTKCNCAFLEAALVEHAHKIDNWNCPWCCSENPPVALEPVLLRDKPHYGTVGKASLDSTEVLYRKPEPSAWKDSKGVAGATTPAPVAFTPAIESATPSASSQRQSMNPRKLWMTVLALMCAIIIGVFAYVALSQPRNVDVQGIRPEYFYTGAIDWDGDFRASLRAEPDVESEHVIGILNGDELAILDEDVQGWYQVEVQSSSNPSAEGFTGWVQRWLVDNTAVPAPPASCEKIPPPFNARLRPSNCVEQSDTLRVDIFEFQPNEVVAYRIINSDGESIADDLTVEANVDGAFALSFRMENYTPGRWHIEFEGADNQAIVHFVVQIS